MTFLPFSTIQINFTLFALNSQFLWPPIPIEPIFCRRHKPPSSTSIPAQPQLLRRDANVVDDIQPPSMTSNVVNSHADIESSSLLGPNSTPTSSTCRRHQLAVFSFRISGLVPQRLYFVHLGSNFRYLEFGTLTFRLMF